VRQVGGVDRAAVDRALEEVFARPELRPPGESWLERQLERLVDLLPGGGALPEAAAWVLVALLALVLSLMLGWLAVQLRRAWAGRAAADTRRAGSTAAAPEADVGDTVAGLRRRAGEARSRGDLAEALRLTFFALLVALGRRGGLEYHEAWTARELLARGRPTAEVTSALAPLVRWVDERTFGRTGVEPADVDRLETLGARLLGVGKERA
jgi:hypothetical protein